VGLTLHAPCLAKGGAAAAIGNRPMRVALKPPLKPGTVPATRVAPATQHQSESSDEDGNRIQGQVATTALSEGAHRINPDEVSEARFLRTEIESSGGRGEWNVLKPIRDASPVSTAEAAY